MSKTPFRKQSRIQSNKRARNSPGKYNDFFDPAWICVARTRKKGAKENIRPLMNVGNETKVGIVVIQHASKAINKSMTDVHLKRQAIPLRKLFFKSSQMCCKSNCDSKQKLSHFEIIDANSFAPMIVTTRKRSCWKVMFPVSFQSVILST